VSHPVTARGLIRGPECQRRRRPCHLRERGDVDDGAGPLRRYERLTMRMVLMLVLLLQGVHGRRGVVVARADRQDVAVETIRLEQDIMVKALRRLADRSVR
jgi:hypothetical protein